MALKENSCKKFKIQHKEGDEGKGGGVEVIYVSVKGNKRRKQSFYENFLKSPKEVNLK